MPGLRRSDLCSNTAQRIQAESLAGRKLVPGDTLMNRLSSERKEAGHVAYADESGTSGTEKCYTIGALLVPEEDDESFRKDVEILIREHGVMGEVKWKKVSNSHGLINFGIHVFKRIIESDCRFIAIVVQKALYRKWQANKENAFYTTYSELFKHAAEGLGRTVRIYIDNRTDSYDKQDEVMEIVTNNMLAQLSSSGKISNVTKADSKELVCLQVADLLTGAFNTAHHHYLNPDWEFSPGKALLISKMAQILGWDRLVYDTYPNTVLNIWHFPIQWRAVPETKNVRTDTSVRFITDEELKKHISRARSKQ